MRCAIVILAVLVMAPSFAVAGEAASPADAKALAAENAKLTRQLRQAEAEILLLTRQLARLKPSVGGGGGGTKGQSGATPAIVYRGRVRTARWFEAMFRKFKGQTLRVDGKTFMQIPPPDDIPDIQFQPSTVGAICKVPDDTRVMQALGGDGALVRRPRQPAQTRLVSSEKGGGGRLTRINVGGGLAELLFHVRGPDVENLVDEAALPQWTVRCVGNYRYRTTNGGSKTIQTYTRVSPITSRDGFRKALASGLVLVEHVKVGKKMIERPIK